MNASDGAAASTSADHWVVRVAERAGFSAEGPPKVASGASAREAWSAVTEAYGVTDEELGQKVADYFRLEVANLDLASPKAAEEVGEALCRKFFVVPTKMNERVLTVATCDPTDVEAERNLGFTSGRSVTFQIAPPSELQKALDDRFASEESIETILGDFSGESEESVELLEEMNPDEVAEEDVNATPVVKITNLVIREGIQQGASDIHIEPGVKQGAVRYRVDGVLRKHMDLPMTVVNRVISRIKILANLDIADRLRPQDGKARVRVGNNAYDLRVSTIRAAGAEKCVIRILDSDVSVKLDDLDIADEELERFRELLSNRDGIVIVTGPTGSGKTTTLYGALRELATGRVNIMTVEDPIEYELPAITQTQIEPKQGVTFASALRAILRQDPDVILIGEIRDEETAEVAAQAAMTGHLVLATVHANDAVSSIPRLLDLGLQYGTIASTLRGAIAQRLVRRVCESCAEPVEEELAEEEERLVERYGVKPTLRGVGCPDCGFTGYRGRLPIDEVMVVGPRIVAAIEARKGWGTLNHLALQGGMRTLLQVGLEAVELGKTTLVEVERVLGGMAKEEEEKERVGPPRILLVDDDEESRLLMRTILAKEGYEIVDAEDGHKALDTLKADQDFSVVVLDLQMPGLDGRQVLNEIRGSVETAALPVLIRTGAYDTEIEAELLEAGADDYVTKNVDPERFLARVRAVLRRSAL